MTERPLHASAPGRSGHTGVRPMTDAERVTGQVARGEVRADPDAAREIAADVQQAGGFWDHPDQQP